MRNATCCLLVVLFGSWLSSFGQTVPNLTSPKIVATFERIGLTGPLPRKTIYTPKKWGTFRISVVMVLTAGNGNRDAFWDGVINYTDGSGTIIPDDRLFTSFRTTTQLEFPFRQKAGKPITFSVLSDGDTSGSKYNVWVVVEQLM